MVDTYTKVVLTVIAIALVSSALQPMLKPAPVIARERAEVEGTVEVRPAFGHLFALKVECVRGCK